jgi:hypothetical protein
MTSDKSIGIAEMSIENRKKEACSRGTSSMGTRRVNKPSKHNDGRLSIRELLLLGCCCLCLGARGLGLTVFCGLATK